MKTLREVLFERHKEIEPKLDGIRKRVVGSLAAATTVNASLRPSVLASGWRQFVWSLRWHLAGLSAAWLAALVLNIDDTPARAQAATRREAPSPQHWMAALRENQRQLRDLIAAPAFEPATEPPKLAPSPRSDTHFFPAPVV